RLMEFRLLDLDQECAQERRTGFVKGHLKKEPRQLRCGLKDKRSGHDGIIGKMVVEDLVAQRDVLHAPSALADHQVGHLVDQEVAHYCDLIRRAMPHQFRRLPPSLISWPNARQAVQQSWQFAASLRSAAIRS